MVSPTRPSLVRRPMQNRPQYSYALSDRNASEGYGRYAYILDTDLDLGEWLEKYRPATPEFSARTSHRRKDSATIPRSRTVRPVVDTTASSSRSASLTPNSPVFKSIPDPKCRFSTIVPSIQHDEPRPSLSRAQTVYSTASQSSRNFVRRVSDATRKYSNSARSTMRKASTVVARSVKKASQNYRQDMQYAEAHTSRLQTAASRPGTSKTTASGPFTTSFRNLRPYPDDPSAHSWPDDPPAHATEGFLSTRSPRRNVRVVTPFITNPGPSVPESPVSPISSHPVSIFSANTSATTNTSQSRRSMYGTTERKPLNHSTPAQDPRSQCATVHYKAPDLPVSSISSYSVSSYSPQTSARMIATQMRRNMYELTTRKPVYHENPASVVRSQRASICYDDPQSPIRSYSQKRR